MKVELIIPIDKLKGMLRKDGFYFRMYRGQQIVQKFPDRSGHKATPAARRPCRPTCGKSAAKPTTHSTTAKPIGNC